MSKYEEKGYTLLNGALNKSWVDRAQKTLNEIEPKVFLPFSDVPWGFGQLHSISPFDEILTNQKLIDTCYELFNTYDYKVNHLLVSNKASFIGPEEMWHQEWPNMGTFSPGCSPMVLTSAVYPSGEYFCVIACNKSPIIIAFISGT